MSGVLLLYILAQTCKAYVLWLEPFLWADAPPWLKNSHKYMLRPKPYFFSCVTSHTISLNHGPYLSDFFCSRPSEYFAGQDVLLNFLLHYSSRMRWVSQWFFQVTARAESGIGSYSGMWYLTRCSQIMWELSDPRFARLDQPRVKHRRGAKPLISKVRSLSFEELSVMLLIRLVATWHRDLSTAPVIPNGNFFS